MTQSRPNFVSFTVSPLEDIDYNNNDINATYATTVSDNDSNTIIPIEATSAIDFVV